MIARFLSLLLLASLPMLALAEIGVVKSAAGDVRIVRGGAELAAKPGDRLEQSDTVVTGENGEVSITFVDATRFSLGPGSRIQLDRFKFNPATRKGEFRSSLKRGSLAVISGQIAKSGPDAMKVATPESVLAVRGTRFVVRVDEPE